MTIFWRIVILTAFVGWQSKRCVPTLIRWTFAKIPQLRVTLCNFCASYYIWPATPLPLKEVKSSPPLMLTRKFLRFWATWYITRSVNGSHFTYFSHTVCNVGLKSVRFIINILQPRLGIRPKCTFANLLSHFIYKHPVHLHRQCDGLQVKPWSRNWSHWRTP